MTNTSSVASLVQHIHQIKLLKQELILLRHRFEQIDYNEFCDLERENSTALQELTETLQVELGKLEQAQLTEEQLGVIKKEMQAAGLEAMLDEWSNR